jgi:hypothetical protein
MEFGEKLDQLVADDDLATTIKHGMVAMMESRSGKMIPDWRVRATFAQMAAAYKVGRPSERKEVEQQKERTLEDFIECAKASPEYRQSMLETYEAILNASA